MMLRKDLTKNKNETIYLYFYSVNSQCLKMVRQFKILATFAARFLKYDFDHFGASCIECFKFWQNISHKNAISVSFINFSQMFSRKTIDGNRDLVKNMTYKH